MTSDAPVLTAPELSSVLGGADPFDALSIDPWQTYATLRERAPICQVGSTGVYLVASWDLVEEAADATDLFSSNLHTILLRGQDDDVLDLWGDGSVDQVLAIADPPSHKVHRSLVLKALSRRIRAMEPEVERIMRQLWSQAVREGRIDFATEIADRLPVRVIAQLIGLPEDDEQRILELTYRTTELLGAVVTPDRLDGALTAPLDLWQYLTEHFDRELAASVPSNELIGILAQACQEGVLEHDVVVGILIQLINAGAESTASLIGNAARTLAERPDLVARLRNDPSALDRFLDEVLRTNGPFLGHYRYVTRDAVLGGVHLPAGSSLLLLWASANLDAGRYDDPTAIDLDRDGIRQHLGFGRGLHFCVGSALARMEATIAVQELLRATRTIALDPQAPARRLPSVMMNRHEHLTLLVG